MTCASCRHWDRYSESDISKKLGDCRFNPPVINDVLLARVMPGMGVSMSEYNDIECDIYVASAFPVTHETSACGRWDSGMPVC